MARTGKSSPREVFGRRAAQYTTSPCHTDPEVLTRVLALASPQPHWQVLDVGTGSGHTAFVLAPAARFVTGVDLTPEMLSEARKLQQQHGLANLGFILADAGRLPFAGASFDLLTCRRAAHHFPQIERALEEIRRVLRPGGLFVLDDRSVPEDDTVDRMMNDFDRRHDPSHVCQYRPSVWRSLLTQAGFEVEVLETYTRHRPLSSLTQDLPEAEVGAMIASLQRLGAELAETFNLLEREGELHFNHWYITIRASTAASG